MGEAEGLTNLSALAFCVGPSILAVAYVVKAYYRGRNARSFVVAAIWELRELAVVVLNYMTEVYGTHFVWNIIGCLGLLLIRPIRRCSEPSPCTSLRVITFLGGAATCWTYMWLRVVGRHSGMVYFPILFIMVGDIALSLTLCFLAGRAWIFGWFSTLQVIHILYFTGLLRSAVDNYTANMFATFITNAVMWVLSCTFETSRRRRSFTGLILCLFWCHLAMHYTMLWSWLPHGIVVKHFALGIVMAILAHSAKSYQCNRLPLHDFRETFRFLKFPLLQRLREADPSFVFRRQQDMPDVLYGDPVWAKYIVVISHPWLAKDDADPHGIHLDEMIAGINARLCPYRHCIARAWWFYFYIDGEGGIGDVLVFFDMSSIPQAPRSPADQATFDRALRSMSYLYCLFDVLVLDSVCSTGDRAVPYLDRGWCWAEVQQARLAGKLDTLSPDILRRISAESAEALKLEDLSRGLYGEPAYPPELVAHGTEEDFAAWRQSQKVKGKLFSAGKTDFDVVSLQLSFYASRARFCKALACNEVEYIRHAFGVDVPGGVGSCRATNTQFANILVDEKFSTPLHVAVANKSEEIVRILLQFGARPAKDALGDFPWERFGFLRCSNAAKLARVQCAAGPPPMDVLRVPAAKSLKMELAYASS